MISPPDSVQRSGGRVLIHCAMGISRSVIILVAWLLKEIIVEGNLLIPLTDPHSATSFVDECISFIKFHRRSILPNSGFMKQLKSWEAKLRGLPPLSDISRSSSNFSLSDLGETSSSFPSSVGPTLNTSSNFLSMSNNSFANSPIMNRININNDNNDNNNNNSNSNNNNPKPNEDTSSMNRSAVIEEKTDPGAQKS